MHIFFSVVRRGMGSAGEDVTPDAVTDAGQLYVVRDPDDESEWQYLGNPEIAARSSLGEVVERFIQDCRGSDGVMAPQHVPAAHMVREALLAAARQVDEAIKASPVG